MELIRLPRRTPECSKHTGARVFDRKPGCGTMRWSLPKCIRKRGSVRHFPRRARSMRARLPEPVGSRLDSEVPARGGLTRTYDWPFLHLGVDLSVAPVG